MAPLTTRLALPVLVKVTVWELLWPTVTFPKLRELGDIVIPVCVPVPVSEIVRGELEASLVTTRFAVAAPAVVGAN